VDKNLRWTSISIAVIAVSILLAVMLPERVSVSPIAYASELKLAKEPYTTKIETNKYIINYSGDIVQVGKGTGTFTPEITMYRWDQECYLKLYEPLINGAVLSQKNAGSILTGDTIQWTSKDLQFLFYPKPIDEQSTYGSFEYEIILANSKAGTDQILSNISFPITSGGLVFYYQPPLTQAEIDEGNIRPDNVVGSYAVYHATKSGHIIGQTNYGAGKAFHIYRPQLIDNAGNTAWADLIITDTALTIDFSNIQEWLKKAKYPVVIDPNFGYETEGGTASGVGMYGPYFYKATSGVAGTGISISACISSPGNCIFEYALYNSSKGYIQNTEESADVVHYKDYYTLNFTSAPEIAASTAYYLGCASEDKGTSFYWDSTSGEDAGYDTTVWGSIWPTPFVYTGNYSTRKYSIYCTYSEEGVPDPPTNVSATDGDHTDKVVITWTKSEEATKYEVFRDGVGLGELGDVATFDDTGADAPTITPGNSVATDGDHTDRVALSLSGSSANNGTTHTYKVKAGNETGWSGDSNTDNGYRGVGSLTYQWQRSAADSDADYGNIVGATSSTYNDTAAPAPTITPGNAVATDGEHTDKVALSLDGTSSDDGAGRWYQCILNATGATQQISASNRGYRGGGALSYQWQRSSGDADADYSNIVGATASTYNDTDAPAGIVTPGTATASDGTSEEHVTLALGDTESVADGAGRWYRCLLTAPDAEGQTSGTNRGYRTTGALTYQWYRSATDADSGYALLGGATTDPYNDTTAPADGSGRWYYCEVSATGAASQNSTHDRGYRAVAPEEPTIITMICSGFARDWAIVNGYIDDAGGIITTIGFDYGLTDAYGDSVTKSGIWTTGDIFWAKIPDLTAGTVYHYRAKAYNGIWGYGSDRVFSTEGSPTLYEYLNTNGDEEGDDIYAGNWSYMQFTVGSVSHSLDFVNIYVKRTGSPGNAILSLRHANDANKPTGADMDIVTLNGNSFSDALDWVTFDFPDDITLEAGESYALVLRCPNGSVDNYLEWYWDSGGSLANAIAGKTTDSGINWTVDAGGADYLFEIWGEPVLEVVGAQVFSGYIEDGDWLIVLTYQNRTTPYYPNENAETYFYIQLIDDTTVKAQTNCPSWGYKPASIYLSKSLADTLEWEDSDYKIRIQGNYAPYPYSDYNLASLDWKGEELSFLDTWVITQADNIGEYYGVEFTTVVATLGKVLNSIGGTIFVDGIPGLNTMRPELFELAIHRDEYTETDWEHTLQEEAVWTTRLGPTISGVLTNMGGWIGIDGKGVGGILSFLVFISVVIGFSIPGHFALGLGIGYPFLAAGAWFGVVDYVLLGVITFLAVVIFIYKVWLVK